MFSKKTLYGEKGPVTLGYAIPKENHGSWSAKISISAEGCLTLTSCYETMGHEFAHLNIDAHINLKPDHSYNSSLFQTAVSYSAGSKEYIEDYVEHKGLKWAGSKGY